MKTLLRFSQLPLSFVFLLSLPSAGFADPVDVTDAQQAVGESDENTVSDAHLLLQPPQPSPNPDYDALGQFTIHDPVESTALATEALSLSSFLLEQQSVETQSSHLAQTGITDLKLSQESASDESEEEASDDGYPASYVTGNFTLTTDYLFRGLSQTNQTLGVQGGLQYNYDPNEKLNLYTGFWSSNVDFGVNSEIDFFAGANYAVNDQLSLGFGTYFYHYTSSDFRPTVDFWEFIPSFTYDFGSFAFTGLAAYSPKYSFGTGEAWTLEGSFNVPINDSFYAAATLGYSWFERNANITIPDYGYWQLGVGYLIDNYDIFVGFSDTGIPKSECIPPGADNCDPTIYASVTYNFGGPGSSATADTESANADDSGYPDSYIAGNVTFGTDYLFRGLSQTNQTPTVQGGLQYNYDPNEQLNLYAGIQGYNVDFGASAEVDFFAGTNYAVNDQLSLGFATYFYHYTSSDFRPTVDFWEFIPSFTYDFGSFAFTGLAAYSPKYSFGTGDAWTLEGSFNVPIDDSFYAAATLGYSWFERNANITIPDYGYWQFGVGYLIDNYDIFLGFSDTGIPKSECIPPGADNCDPAVVMSVTYSW